ncbi:MAG: E2/UBC family protein [Acidimicrobiales bacterium]
MDALAGQLAELQRRYPEAHLESAPGGPRVIVVPGVLLGAGWSAASATVRVLVPIGFPHVKPDCFYTDANLRLATGAEPAASNLQAAFAGKYRWFSWHIATWDPVRGSLDQYVHVCESRLKEVR